jgi:dihydroorotase
MIDSILFRDMSLVTALGLRQADVLVENGKIKTIGWDLPQNAELIVEDSGLLLMPGCIDTHVHFRDPGLTHKEDLESGSRAAASGGVTTFFDMPNTKPSTTTQQLMAAKKRLASQKSLINYNFYIGATEDNLDECLSCENIPGIKIFMGSSTGDLMIKDPQALERFFATGSRLIAVHAEDEAIIAENKARFEGSRDVSDHPFIRSPEAALAATKHAVALAQKYNRRLHICHLTTQEEAIFLSKLETEGLISTEVSPQHLLLSAPSVYDKWGTMGQINPPIREARHGQALWRALKAGTIGSIATDHAPHTIEEKEVGYPRAHSGMPCIEHSLPLMLTLVNQNKCSLVDVVRWMSTHPAAAFGIDKKGRIEEGYDADLILVDMNAKKVIKRENIVSKCGWSAFEGHRLHGLPIATFVNGQLVYREGDFFTDIKGKEAKIVPSWESRG